jgi:predicted nucleotidyltransferase
MILLADLSGKKQLSYGSKESCKTGAKEMKKLPKGKIFPDDILQDIQKVESILLHYGATKIILYGSLARGDYKADSDIDVCVEGVPNEHYFRVVAECLMKVQRPVSVLDFQGVRGYFREKISQEGKILYEHK